jgi:hypothetical protein
VEAQDRMLASDAEREAIVARLQAATSEGRLRLDEFSDRVDQAYAARTRGELARVIQDLPVPLPPPPAYPPPPPMVGTNTPALLSLIFGIVSIPSLTLVVMPFGIVAIVLGIVGLHRAQPMQSSSRGRGPAVAGLVLGSVTTLVQLTILLVAILAG